MVHHLKLLTILAIALATMAFGSPVITGKAAGIQTTYLPVTQVSAASPGSIIELPNADKYVVASGDNLASIAARFDTTVETILQANPQITNPRLLYAGDRLIIPEATEEASGGN